MNWNRRSEIGRAVDSHADDVRSYIARQSEVLATGDYRFVPMGPISVRENFRDPPPTVDWKSENYGWNEISSDFEIVLRNPTPKNWFIINQSVRSILTDDQSRIVHGDSYSIGHADEVMIRSLLDLTEKCAQNRACTQLTLTDQGRSWLLRQWDYPELLTDLKNSTNHMQSETALRRW